jgi:tRNA (guanine37-N1)-methyltransferase
MRVDVVTVLPDIFDAPMSASMVGIARDKGLLDLHVHDLRDWALPGVHRQVDDAPYGGGPGMVMRTEPLFSAVRAVAAMDEAPPLVLLMDPAGEPMDQAMAEELALAGRLLIVCGRYEGFDDRVRTLVDRAVSIGDYVLTGGELPAMVLIDAVSRLVPGVLGSDESATQESFSWGLLEYPQYTRPAEYEGLSVPEVLLSGDHGRVALWRRERAVERTARLRPDLLVGAELTEQERELARRVLLETDDDTDR